MSGLALTLAAVLGASLVGSLHCVGMCGGFVASVSGQSCSRAPSHARSSDPAHVGRTRWAPLLAYQLARGTAYTGLGALAGLLGAGLDASAAIVGIQRLAGPLMGVVLIAMAVMTLRGPKPDAGPLITLGGGLSGRPKPSPMTRLRLALTVAVRERGATAGAAAGLLSALLPCGWLWAYLAVAASTGSVAHGSLVMAVFWLGSVPALMGVGLLAGELSRRLGRHAPRITAALLLGLGILGLSGKLTMAPVAHAPADQAAHAPASDADPTDPAPDAGAVPREAPCH